MRTRSIPNGKQVDMWTKHAKVYYHARRSGKSFYSLRANRTILAADNKPLRGVHELFGQTYIVTKRTSAEAKRTGRLPMVPYMGRFPRLALLWADLKDTVKEALCRG